MVSVGTELVLSLLCASLIATAGRADEVADIAKRIDDLIAARCEMADVTPAPVADDAEFMRRVYLDLGGKIPPVMDVREFLADESSDKRRQLVEKLLESPNYVAHFTEFWTNVLIPEAKSDLQLRFLKPGFEAWLSQKLAQDVPYDTVVREILTVPFPKTPNYQFQEQFTQSSAAAFYTVKQGKPENLAAATTRTFLGLRIECAQCHDHPFDTWERKEFWSTAAFFASVGNQSPQAVFSPLVERNEKRDIKIPDSEAVVKAAFLNGSEPDWTKHTSPRSALAAWITAEDNPYFARAAVNRMWGQMFGIGIVEPVDDFSSNNPPSHPALLDELATAFVEHDFDTKFILRVITASETYQRSSQRTHTSQDNPRLFAKMNLRGLTSRQLFNSLAQATGFYDEPMRRLQLQFSYGQNDPKSELLQAFENTSDSAVDRETTIIQALAMMNGKFTGDAIKATNNFTIGAILDYPGMNTAQRIETLYLAALSRRPRLDELEKLTKFVEQGRTKAQREAYGHLFWALLNSSEFMFNH